MESLCVQGLTITPELGKEERDGERNRDCAGDPGENPG